VYNKNFRETYKNLKIIVTGSTGFKGAWLCYWLNKLGAKVTGVGLRPDKNNVIFKSLNLEKKIKQHILDIRDFTKLNSLVKRVKPDIIFHLAAQSIVSESYNNPLETLKTNTLGSSNLLEIVKKNKIENLIYITSDKCYLNFDSTSSFKEKDTLGGKDIYSSSKASAEIIFQSYHESFFRRHNKYLNKVTARAGNVIGGGDFKDNRIIPDLIRSIRYGKKLILRNPNSTRPWQHVLEPLSGYMLLGKKVMEKKLSNKFYPSWNFGPTKNNCKKVIEIIRMFYDYLNLPKNFVIKHENKIMKEAKLLSLNISKAKKELNWQPSLSLDESIGFTCDWYTSYLSQNQAENVTEDQIEFFSSK